MPSPIDTSRWRFAEIVWNDANASSDWDKLEDIPRSRQMITRGWIISEDKRGITVAATLDLEGPEEQFSESIAIPFGCIVEIREV